MLNIYLKSAKHILNICQASTKTKLMRLNITHLFDFKLCNVTLSKMIFLSYAYKFQAKNFVLMI